jgi:hypothetical protein
LNIPPGFVFCLTALTATFFLSCLGALAQSHTSSVVGMVVDPAGKGIHQVAIELYAVDAATHSLRPCATAISDRRGRFAFAGLSPGIYGLHFARPGWQSHSLTRLEISSAGTSDVKIALSPAAVNAGLGDPKARPREVMWGTNFGTSSLRTFPNAGNVWSLLESQEHSTVTDRIDIGGLETGVPALLGALGASWTENQYSLNGLDVTDPYQPGRPLIDPDLETLHELHAVAGSKPALLGGSGLNLELTSPEASSQLHGSAQWFYSTRRLQSNNLNARLEHFHFPGPERLNHLLVGDAQLGGKIPSARFSWPFFLSVGTQQVSKGLGGFGSPIELRADRVLVDLRPYSGSHGQLDLLYSGQHIFDSRGGAELLVAPEATTLDNNNFHQFQAHWGKNLSPSTFLGASFGVAHATISSGLQHDLLSVATLELPQGDFRGAAPLALGGLRTRYEANAHLNTVTDNGLGNHGLNIGADFGWNEISNRWDSLQGIEQILANGAGAEVLKWDTPARARSHTSNLALFGQDAWRPVPWLSMPLGLRSETSSGRAVGSSRSIRWTTIQPRVGLIVPLHRRGPILRASWSRYAHLLQGRYLDFGDPSAIGGRVYRWNDRNGDQQAQTPEIGTLLSVFGGPYSALDPGLARPFTDEVSVGLDRGFGEILRLSVRFFRRDDHRLIGFMNLGVPFSSYASTAVLEPGNDGIFGTADDQVLTLYNRSPSTLGKDFLLLTNPPWGHASYKGFEIRLDKPMRRLWEYSASFAAMQTLGATNPGNSVMENDMGVIGSLGTDPNTLVMAASRTYFDRAFIGKATGYYLAPFGIRLSAVTKYYDGLPFGRLLFIDGFNQGPFFVRATPRGHPGGFQTQFNFTLDFRIAREFAFRGGTFSGYLDFFNLTNVSKNTLESDLTGPAFASRVPLAIEAPRLARLGLEYRF